MVYRGPSQGCQTCRERRVKCDGLLPCCRNCIKRGKSCPGPKDSFDMVLRDKSAIVAEQVGRKAEQARSRKSGKSSGLSSTSEQAKAQTGNPTKTPPSLAVERTITSTKAVMVNSVLEIALVPQDVEHESLCFLFSNFTSRSNSQATAGFAENLFPLYFEAEPNSPLSLATSAVATNVLSQRKLQRADTHVSRSFYAKCVIETQAALLDPCRNQSDHLLATVLMLDFYELLTGQFYNRPPYRRHREGAVALVNHRGPENFSSELSRRLIMAVRMSMLSSTDRDGERLVEEDASNAEYPEIHMDRLSLEFAQMKSNADNVMPNDCTEYDEELLNKLWCEAAQLDALFKGWYDILPASWTPETIPMAIPSTRSDGTREIYCEVYPKIYMAGVMNTYRRLRIVTLQIMGRCNRALSIISKESVVPDAYIVGEIKELRQYLLHDFTPSEQPLLGKSRK